MTGLEIISKFEGLYPLHLAYDWDNVGLQIGRLDKEVTSVLLTLDVTIEVVEEAIKSKSNVIIGHHPLVFSPLKTIDVNTPIGKIIELLIKNDITLYIAHTNFDVSNYGMDHMLANMLELEDIENLDQVTDNEGLGKIGTIKPTPIGTFIKKVKEVFSIEHARFVGDENQLVQRVAISGGSGSSNMFNAALKKADLFITGDLTYHKALECKTIGLNTLDVGHHIEHHFMNHLKNILEEEGVTRPILVSKINTNPYQNV